MGSPKYKVQLRGGFSDRNGIDPINTEIQVDSLDERTRIKIINTVTKLWMDILPCTGWDPWTQEFLDDLLGEVYLFEASTDTLQTSDDVVAMVCDTIREDEYDAVLSVIEYLVSALDSYQDKMHFETHVCLNTMEKMFNTLFEREYVGYRFVNGLITPITDHQELSAIDEATANQQTEVKEHLDKALGFLSDRNAPDYENSIKESISAVERMCSIIMGKGTTLGDALKHLEGKGVMIHGALKTAFRQLYGYTSDGSGIRHAGELGGPGATFEEAKFMLVSCCAFINYLKGVMAKAL